MASRAPQDKEHKNAELLQGDRCRLVVVGMEMDDLLGKEAFQFVDMLCWQHFGRYRMF